MLSSVTRSGHGCGCSKSVFAHVSACGCAKTVCMWSVCEWSGGCVGLTSLQTGHTAGVCAFTRQTQAVLLQLVTLSRILDLEPPYWGSDVKAYLLPPGIQGLGAQLYLLFAVCSFLICLVSFLRSMGCPWAGPVRGLRLGPLPACVCSCTLWFGSHSCRHLCTVWILQRGAAVPIALRARLPGSVLAEG